uniref:NADH-ubiquinone oxidoreductase chain 4L n=4 Tax=Ichthyomyzon TaxID=7772 RepID=A7YDH4_9PETR|nr:NADH dehydrogenase subunit 4L [Ichthyomyzon fossor]YP_009106948.1 NADH dehydrogenase subunit 4L [Ichthyomyzon unicuspis]YP_009353564.1 NADH dehydrogenase subunit 4L [Ichthyomyzon gagei]ABK19979.1 NADH dehydrogenase subunit 4L [Ichthyomyzon unicuspis]ABK19981.1 NADH dehydrogenase subunit 4L [Ichthyomyzon unicuspis]ABK19983.1 NADH dehydrogenase subunit 4L [Ichthyomyzon fossor]ABK19985.1 NADH dehydrogenase subunit 4L [Ichthyomyzon fossor]ABK19987.1 NADH dehydrogenase subunit 4L [Ichthyomyzon
MPTTLIFASFFLALLGLSLQRKHLLSLLLTLESMALTLYVTTALWALNSTSLPIMVAPLIILTFSACEAGMGLSLMIATARTHNTDQLKALNLLKC